MLEGVLLRLYTWRTRRCRRVTSTSKQEGTNESVKGFMYHGYMLYSYWHHCYICSITTLLDRGPVYQVG
jgi:hypothetical protein